MKKIGAFLLNYFDKLLLGLFLVFMALAMVKFGKDLEDSRAAVRETRGAIELPSGILPELDPETVAYDLSVDNDRLWGTRYLPPPRSILPGKGAVSPAMLRHLRDRSEGSLFDPLLYVYSRDPSEYILHYDTKRNPYTGVPQVFTNRPVRPDPDPDADPDGGEEPPTNIEDEPPVAITQPAEMLRIFRTRTERLNVMLKKVTPTDPNQKEKWTIQVNVAQPNGRVATHLPSLGEVIEGTRWRITDVNWTKERRPDDLVAREVASITIVRTDNDDELTIGLNERPAYGETTYMLFDLRDLKSPTLSVGVGQTFSLQDNQGRQRTYKLRETAAGGGVEAVELVGSGQGEVFRLRRISRAEIDDWKERQELAKRALREEPTMDDEYPEDDY